MPSEPQDLKSPPRALQPQKPDNPPPGAGNSVRSQGFRVQGVHRVYRVNRENHKLWSYLQRYYKHINPTSRRRHCREGSAGREAPPRATAGCRKNSPSARRVTDGGTAARKLAASAGLQSGEMRRWGGSSSPVHLAVPDSVSSRSLR